MFAIHDQLSRQVRNRLKSTVMGLGLVRLLQDAGRTGEARSTLVSLENGFAVKKSDKPNRERRKTDRLKGASRRPLSASA